MIALILNAVPASIWAALAALVGVLAAYIGGKRSGATAAKNKAAEKAAENYRATNERMQNADTGNSDGSGDAEWLRKRAKR